MKLNGGDAENDLEFKRSEVNHLRLVLAWMRTEYMLDEDVQKGFAESAVKMVELGFSTEEKSKKILADQAAKIRHVPNYVRQGVKMLTKMLREHEKRGDVTDGEVMKNRLDSPSGVSREH